MGSYDSICQSEGSEAAASGSVHGALSAWAWNSGDLPLTPTRRPIDGAVKEVEGGPSLGQVCKFRYAKRSDEPCTRRPSWAL